MLKFDISTREKSLQLLKEFEERAYSSYPTFPEDLLDDYFNVLLNSKAVPKISHFFDKLFFLSFLSGPQRKKLLEILINPLEAYTKGNIRRRVAEYIVNNFELSEVLNIINNLLKIQNAHLLDIAEEMIYEINTCMSKDEKDRYNFDQRVKNWLKILKK